MNEILLILLTLKLKAKGFNLFVSIMFEKLFYKLIL